MEGLFICFFSSMYSDNLAYTAARRATNSSSFSSSLYRFKEILSKRAIGLWRVCIHCEGSMLLNRSTASSFQHHHKLFANFSKALNLAGMERWMITLIQFGTFVAVFFSINDHCSSSTTGISSTRSFTLSSAIW